MGSDGGMPKVPLLARLGGTLKNSMQVQVALPNRHKPLLAACETEQKRNRKSSLLNMKLELKQRRIG